VNGPLAQHGRAPQWHCGGHRFDPGTVHAMYSVYILQSEQNGRYYIGHTDSLSRRLAEHNNGLSKYTKQFRPWRLVCVEHFETRSLAMNREAEIKRKKSRTYIAKLIRSLEERPVTHDV
jgi:putative endonuclease